MIRALCCLLAGVLVAALSANPARAEPVTIRIGYGTAAEEQVWLLLAKPELGAGAGKLYRLDGTKFNSSEMRAQVFEAGSLDISTFSGSGMLLAAAAGVNARVIASLARESRRGDFTTSFMALKTSPINQVADLKGKTLAPNGFSTAGELWIRAELEGHGMSESDVTLVPVSFPAMMETLRSGQIDVGELPQPFAAIAEKENLVKTIFTAKDAVPFDEELIVLGAKPDFLTENGAAVQAFLADLRAATRFYLDHTAEARQILIDKKFVRVEPGIYLAMKDYYRDPTMRIDVAALKEMQDLEVKDGFQAKAIDVDQLVDLSYLPK